MIDRSDAGELPWRVQTADGFNRAKHRYLLYHTDGDDAEVDQRSSWRDWVSTRMAERHDI